MSLISLVFSNEKIPSMIVSPELASPFSSQSFGFRISGVSPGLHVNAKWIPAASLQAEMRLL